MIKLPSFIRDSAILSEKEKQLLEAAASLPSEMQVDAFRARGDIQELTNAFIGDESTRDIHLQEKAKEFLALGDVDSAWKVILL